MMIIIIKNNNSNNNNNINRYEHRPYKIARERACTHPKRPTCSFYLAPKLKATRCESEDGDTESGFDALLRK